MLNYIISLKIVAKRSVHFGLNGVECLQQPTIFRSKSLFFNNEVIAKNGLHRTKEVFEIFLLRLGIINCLVAIIHRLVPWLHQKHQSQLPGRMFFQSLANCDKVLERFRHFQTLDVQVTCMQKVIHPLAALMVGFRLSHFIVVMRKHQINSSTVNIKIFTNHIACHNAALNMPTWTTGSPRRLPRWLTGIARFPQDKIIPMFFFRVTTC
mmetsp:Transcript_30576/g.65610  ORF Transcript_30576/g.65610 Transcript_30576/m.65610 type:complete len:209 (-) Transcript_30576:971-1597(-)